MTKDGAACVQEQGPAHEGAGTWCPRPRRHRTGVGARHGLLGGRAGARLDGVGLPALRLLAARVREGAAGRGVVLGHRSVRGGDLARNDSTRGHGDLRVGDGPLGRGHLAGAGGRVLGRGGGNVAAHGDRLAAGHGALDRARAPGELGAGERLDAEDRRDREAEDGAGGDQDGLQARAQGGPAAAGGHGGAAVRLGGVQAGAGKHALGHGGLHLLQAPAALLERGRVEHDGDAGDDAGQCGAEDGADDAEVAADHGHGRGGGGAGEQARDVQGRALLLGLLLGRCLRMVLGRGSLGAWFFQSHAVLLRLRGRGC